MLNLGTETGSLVNHLYSRMTIGAPAPTVGMAATLLGWTDRHAATVVDVDEDAGRVTVQWDKSAVVSGSCQDGSAVYEYARDPNGTKQTFRRTKTGGWEQCRWNTETRRWKKVDGNGLILGKREEYRDPSF